MYELMTKLINKILIKILALIQTHFTNKGFARFSLFVRSAREL